MEQHKMLVFGTAAQLLALILMACLFYAEIFSLHNIPIDKCFGGQNPSTLGSRHYFEMNNQFLDLFLSKGERSSSPLNVTLSSRNDEVLVEENRSIVPLLSKLVRGEDRIKLESTGYSCDSARDSLVCVSSNPVKIDTSTMQVHLQLSSDILLRERPETLAVRPYARQQDEELLKYITPVEFVLHEYESNTTGTATAASVTTSLQCEHNHTVPAVIFSSRGFVENPFHQVNEIIIPLYLTTRHFNSDVRFILVDYNPTFVTKYAEIFSRLSRYEVMNPKVNSSIHCFPAVVAGLKFHDFLTLNSSDIPEGHTMPEFRQFLRETYNVKIKDVSEIASRPPVLLLISRRRSRLFLNENEMVDVMEELGFEVVVVKSDKQMSNLKTFSKLVSSSSVLFGVHGAGLTNELFMPAGGVVVQVVPFGLVWPSEYYFGRPATQMGLNYLAYKIEPEESSLIDSYASNDTVFTDPELLFSKGYQVGKAVYLDGQSVKMNLDRLRGTLIEVLRLLGRTTPISSR